MKTNENHYYRMVFLAMQKLMVTAMCILIVVCCSNDVPDPQPAQTGEIKGTVKDENGNPYPSTLVSLAKGIEKNTRATNEEGAFTLVTKDIGSYDVEMALPLSTEAVSANPNKINVLGDQAATVDFVIRPKSLEAHLNFGDGNCG